VAVIITSDRVANLDLCFVLIAFGSGVLLHITPDMTQDISPYSLIRTTDMNVPQWDSKSGIFAATLTTAPCGQGKLNTRNFAIDGS
jgi:hypothetical protein